MDRCAPLRPGLGEDQRSVLEFESGKRYAPRRFLVLGEPAQPSGDHEVQHQEQRAFELEHDALAHAAHAFHFPARDRIQGRRYAAEHEGVEKAQPSASAAIVSSEMPALRPRGTWTNHSKCCVHALETTSMTNSLMR